MGGLIGRPLLGIAAQQISGATAQVLRIGDRAETTLVKVILASHTHTALAWLMSVGVEMKFAVILACSVALLPTAAFADWQFTRWGMTPTQVVAAGKPSGPIVAAPPNAEGNAQYTGSYRSGSHTFKATYTFADGKLSVVTLETTNGCQDLSVEMSSVYGEPVDKSNIAIGQFTRWMDRKNLNDVSLLDFDDSCTLIYKELDVASRSGL